MHDRGHDFKRIKYENVEDIEDENPRDDITKVKVDVPNFDVTYYP